MPPAAFLADLPQRPHATPGAARNEGRGGARLHLAVPSKCRERRTICEGHGGDGHGGDVAGKKNEGARRGKKSHGVKGREREGVAQRTAWKGEEAA